jgi:hypothetical protein
MAAPVSNSKLIQIHVSNQGRRGGVGAQQHAPAAATRPDRGARQGRADGPGHPGPPPHQPHRLGADEAGESGWATPRPLRSPSCPSLLIKQLPSVPMRAAAGLLCAAAGRHTPHTSSHMPTQPPFLQSPSATPASRWSRRRRSCLSPRREVTPSSTSARPICLQRATWRGRSTSHTTARSRGGEFWGLVAGWFGGFCRGWSRGSCRSCRSLSQSGSRSWVNRAVRQVPVAGGQARGLRGLWRLQRH